jgi:uncharacterized protein (TIGR02246 family)
MRRAEACLLACAALLVGCGAAPAAGGGSETTTPTTSSSTASGAAQHSADERDIRRALNAWPAAWDAHDAGAVCDLFAPDAVFVFPGGPDRTYGQACAQFTDLINRTDRSIVYQPPEIEDVLVDGDLAVVRLTWTGTIKGVDGSLLEQTKERGLDVFGRQDDGHWRITTSYAFPLD